MFEIKFKSNLLEREFHSLWSWASDIYIYIYRTRSQLFLKKKIKNESEIEFLAPSGNIHQKFH